MKSVGIFLLTVLTLTYLDLATSPVFAQETPVTPTPTAASSPTPKPKTSRTPTPTIENSLNITPTVTPKVTQPVETTTPTPKQSPTSTPPPSPTEAVQNTPEPVLAQSTEIVTTPTPTPQPVVLNHTIQSALPLGRIITAPFDLVTNYLPKNYYNDQGLTPQTNKLLLILSFLCISSGIGLLQWPFLMRAKNHFASSSRKRHEFPPVIRRTG